MRRGVFIIFRTHRLHKLLSGKVFYYLCDGLCGVNLDSLHHGALRRIALRDKNFVYAQALCFKHHGKNSRNGFYCSLKRKLADKGAAFKVRFNLAIGAKKPEQNRQVIK